MADPATGRAYGLTLLLGLASAAAVAVGTARPWASATSAAQPGFPTQQATVSGADVAPLAAALGVVLLAAFGAVVATRGWVRRVLGGLVVLASAVVLAAAVTPGDARATLTDGLRAQGFYHGSYTTQPQPWRWLVVAGAVGCLLAGVTVARHGGRWATMGRRYDAPGAAAAAPPSPSPQSPGPGLTDAELWRAIDDGEDPTQTP